MSAYLSAATKGVCPTPYKHLTCVLSASTYYTEPGSRLSKCTISSSTLDTMIDVQLG